MTQTPGTSITELGRALRRREISAAQLAADAVRAVRDRNAALNAFVLVDEAGAAEAARRADQELASGLDRGPLHGIPVAVKDLIDMAGLPTTCGSATSSGAPAARDAAVVTRLRERGAVIVGKTTLHEFAYGATGDRSVHGPARNPRDPGRMSGGSSGGSAVAVAAGMVPLSLGTDTAGSVRVPAALCGTVGFKPAYDAIPSTGVHPLAPSLDHVGLFTGSVGDALLGYQALTDQPVRPLPGDARSITVGWIRAGDIARCDPRIEELTHELVTRAGLACEKVPGFPGWDRADDLFDVFTTLQSREAFEVHQHHLDSDRDRIDAEVFARLDRGRHVSAADYERADAARRELGSLVQELLATHDLLALPTVPFVAPPIGARSVPVDGTELEVRSALLSLTSPWNLTGTPAISVPAGWHDGLPAAVQLVAAPGHEHLLFAAAQAVEAAARDGR
ncbi:amidase [Amycolatopsis viridis]|uniref:Aspartyl-tRNA(Asn)/glutamyl-tRNA(Gln) amidotransferase subunit A n=1 Tax=Amycolatopsis viridis TaxID=185678 RepID=A0ABX0SYD6_9PSEU|nr:amidase [Amycolatopsis viridis]NIH81538.1 aspartyl-tRNA(Asn)/glutamyl-tRNA(Gln) amidotransferase subunit A [Amycolatopsis viridis]